MRGLGSATPLPALAASAHADLAPLYDALLTAALPEQQRVAAQIDILRGLGAGAAAEGLALCWSQFPVTAELREAAIGAAPALVQPLLRGRVAVEKVWAGWIDKPKDVNAEGLRRLLLTLAADVRVVLMMLAEQLVLLRGLVRADPALQQLEAKRTADFHAPLANRLGLSQTKWELEDLSFRLLQPERYQEIKAKLDEKRGEREAYIARVIADLHDALQAEGIQAEVTGRPKHIFSIWKKMTRKELAFEELYDIRAVRILVDTVGQCYAALGVVHGTWRYIPKEFDDYIAQPKGNNYRSLHTAVYGPDERTIEVQIRTRLMHSHAELGVAAHWQYKEGGKGDAGYQDKINLIRQLLDTRDDTGDQSALIKGYSIETLDDRVYALTPDNKVLVLAPRATALDFAYAVHSSVGHGCIGATVNGRIVPLTHQLNTGDTVSIRTQKSGVPRRDWLNPHAGFLNTSRARAKVKAFFNRAARTENLAAGRAMLEREFKRAGLPHLDFASVAHALSLQDADELLIKVALGDLGLQIALRAAREVHGEPPAVEVDAAPVTVAAQPGDHRDAIVIDGVGNLLINIAACCHPLPGDGVRGFITRGRGVSVHRRGCRTLKALAEREPERIVDVDWGRQTQSRYGARLVLTASDRQGLIRDVSALLSGERVNLLKLTSKVDPRRAQAVLNIEVEVENEAQLQSIQHKLKGVDSMLSVERT